MRKGDIKNILVNGEEISAKFLGKGRFAEAYRVDNDVYLFVNTCVMKEALVLAGDVIYLPKIEQLGTDVKLNLNSKKRFDMLFRMDYYPDISPSDKEAWDIFRKLQRAMENAWSIMPPKSYANDIAHLCIELADVPELVKDSLGVLASSIANYGEGCTFEFAKRNIGVDSNGNIIFRDICYDVNKL